MSFNLDLPYVKPVDKRILNKSIDADGAYWNHSVNTALSMFQEACWHFTDGQYVNVLANIITTRAGHLGGGQLIDQITKELQKRKPVVIETMID